MEGRSIIENDDNCSQIEKAFKRMKVGSSRNGRKGHHHPSHHHHHVSRQHRLPTDQSSPNYRVNSYFNQLFTNNCRVISDPEDADSLETNERRKTQHCSMDNCNATICQGQTSVHSNGAHHTMKYELDPPDKPDVSVEELAAYLDVQLHIPRKMSYMAELMYT